MLQNYVRKSISAAKDRPEGRALLLFVPRQRQPSFEGLDFAGFRMAARSDVFFVFIQKGRLAAFDRHQHELLSLLHLKLVNNRPTSSDRFNFYRSFMARCKVYNLTVLY